MTLKASFSVCYNFGDIFCRMFNVEHFFWCIFKTDLLRSHIVQVCMRSVFFSDIRVCLGDILTNSNVVKVRFL